MRDLIDELVAHCADLRRQLRRELKDPYFAEDIAQSSFERVYQQALDAGQIAVSGGAFEERQVREPIESPRALLFKVARNLCIDEARRRQVAQRWAAQHTDADIRLTAPSSEYVHAQRQVIARVVETLEKLPPLRREVFLQFRAYGLTRAEIAGRLKLTEAAVAKHLVRAAVDCSRAFAELATQLMDPETVPAQNHSSAILAEDHP